MKEIIILSGKGGTGKTSTAAAFATLADNCIIADCDVDAADLHLILQPQIVETNDFYGGKEAFISAEKCTGCGKCLDLCRFGAVINDGGYSVNPLMCEGCGVCAAICPENAISMEDAFSGQWFVSKTRMGGFVHAKLGVSGENSGKLVSVIRKRAKLEAEKINADFILVDGSPGIGCPVIASITGADFVLIVTEPTVSGIHDMKRIVRLIKHFGIKSGAVVNKCDINPEKVGEIKAFAVEESIELLGEIPYDREITEAQFAGKSIIEYSNGKTSESVKKIWEKTCRAL